jgi:hypothetical protein
MEMHWFELGMKSYILTYRPDASGPSVAVPATGSTPNDVRPIDAL